MLLLVVTGLVAGCDNGGGGGNGGGSGGAGGVGNSGGGGGNVDSRPPDVTAPTVTAIAPIDDTPEVPTNGRLAVTFSEAMTPTDVSTTSFRLTDGTTAIPGTVSFDEANYIAVFTPDNGFAPNTRYTATAVTGMRDKSGNPLMTDFAWCFETGASTDGEPPVVTMTFPANVAVDVAINRNITATFSEHMDSSSLTPTSFSVTGPGATPVPGTVRYLRGTAIFSPVQNLAANTLYRATIGAGVKDLAGNAASAVFTWSFTTGTAADVAAPVVSSTNPVSAQPAVAIGTPLSVVFSEPIDPASVTTESFFVRGPGAAVVIGTVALDTSTNTATFTRIDHLTTPVASHLTPVSDLEPDTEYTATLTTGVTDLAGNALASNLVWTFTTASATEPPPTDPPATQPPTTEPPPTDPPATEPPTTEPPATGP